MRQETVACKICGNQTPMLGTRLCDCCWELESRIRNNPELALKILTNLGINLNAWQSKEEEGVSNE